jgi:predicted metal-dependent phosphoesterase TrpH
MPSLLTGLTLAADAAVDLQLHTTHSDGRWTPAELIDYLVAEGFALAAVTDHDRVDTVSAVQDLAARRHLPILAAVEMSSTWEGDLTDVLCYGFDPQANALQDLARSVVEGQLANLQAVYATLVAEGFRFPHQAAVLAATGGALRTPQDLARLVHEHGYPTDGRTVGQVLIAAGFRYITTEIATIVEAAHQSGAVCILAHPGRSDGFTCYDPARLDAVRRVAPLDGLEVYYPTHTMEQAARFRAYAATHDLLVSSGSDSHGPPGQMPIKYPAAASRRLLERLGIAVQG